jgi:hypothetical protein
MPHSTREPRLRLAADARLETATSPTGVHVLRRPSGTIALNDIAVQILRLCDGHHSRLDVIRRVRAPPRHVNAFIDAACSREWITEDTSHIRMH